MLKWEAKKTKKLAASEENMSDSFGLDNDDGLGTCPRSRYRPNRHRRNKEVAPHQLLLGHQASPICRRRRRGIIRPSPDRV